MNGLPSQRLSISMDGIFTDYSVDLSVTSYSINARLLVLLPT